MTDTDKLIAAIFAATMTARETAAKPGDFFAYYDACIVETLRREAAETVLKDKKTLAAQIKAWG